MQKPSWWSNNLSLGNAITIGMLVFSIGFGWAKVEASAEANENWRREYDRKIEELKTKVAPVEGMTYRMGQQEASMNAINARVDRAVDAITDQLKELRKDVGSVNTSIAVLTRSIDARRQDGDNLGMPGKVQAPR